MYMTLCTQWYVVSTQNFEETIILGYGVNTPAFNLTDTSLPNLKQCISWPYLDMSTKPRNAKQARLSAVHEAKPEATAKQQKEKAI